MEKERIINVPITNDILQTVIGDILVEGKSKEALSRLLLDLIKERPVVCEYFIKFCLGQPFPVLPKMGAIGYLKIDSVWWGETRQAYLDSPYNHHGYMMCIVCKVGSIIDYQPLYVAIPKITSGQSGEINVELNNFIPELGLDIYNIT